MADNVDVTPGTGKTVLADEITHATLGTGIAQLIKLVDGTIGGTNEAIVTANGDLQITLDSETVAITSADLATIAGAVAGTEMQADIVTSALPTGAATQATLADVETNTDYGATTGGGTEAGALRVTLANNSTGVSGATDEGPGWTSSFGVSGAAFTSADASTAAAVTDAPTGGQKLVITDIIFSVDTAMQVDFEIETAGTVYLTQHCAANTTYQITPRSKLKLGTADKKLMVDTSVAGNISVTCFYYSEA